MIGYLCCVKRSKDVLSIELDKNLILRRCNDSLRIFLCLLVECNGGLCYV